MTGHDLSRAVWRKSTHSGQDGNCVEVATNLPGIVAIRDSKNPNGPILCVTHTDWVAFLGDIKAERPWPILKDAGSLTSESHWFGPSCAYQLRQVRGSL